MTAEIVAIGTELLLGEIADTDSQLLGRLLAQFGVNHTRRTTVGDNLERMVQAIREALQRADLVFTIGGLGPTQDDLTRHAIAEALGEELITDEAVVEWLRKRTEERRRPWVDSLARQALRPACCKTIENPVGTAPGLICEKDGKTVIALPGPKSEFRNMLDGAVTDWLAERSEGVILSQTVRIVGIPEAAVEERVRDLVEGANPTVAPLVKPGEVHLRVTAKAATEKEAQALISPVAAYIRERFGNAAFGEGGRDLAEEVVDLLRSCRRTLATAESCTGGMLGERITSVAGASDVYLGGYVTYSNEMKARMLAVERVDLDRFGAVSEPVARQMAEGARRSAGSDYGVAITGIAGPSGGTPEKPVGLVYIVVAGPGGMAVCEERFGGDRENVRVRATQAALAMLRERLVAE
ncbi:MAG: competence/damage-inducible protein A [Armatimonadetes bacterium]|nr:competence/damage-inducible protein A [Armatimonadota bacterium]